VENAFGFTRRAARIKDEKGSFAVHFLRRTMGADLGDFVVPPDIAAFLEADFVAGAVEHDYFFNGFGLERAVGTFECQGFINVLFKRNDRSAAKPAIGGNDETGLRILDAVSDRLGAEASEDD